MTEKRPGSEPRGARRTVGAVVGGVAAVVMACASVQAATRFDPALRFRVLGTEHFRIYFHRGSEALASRLAVIAEDTWRALERPLGRRPPPLTHVVLADQTELANAYATPLPYDTVVIYPTWPTGAEFDVDDWLRLVFTHEFTHIVHLDRSESWARVVRRVFGRSFIAFPNLFLPTWQIEGLATYEESARTGEGRLHAGDFRAIVDEAARTRTFQPLDRVNGGLTDWPGGQAAYAYGAQFHEYLAEQFGADRLAVLADQTARRVPYTSAPVFSRIFGKPLGALWRDFESARAHAAGSETDSGATRLTDSGFISSAPRFDRSCGECPAALVYSLRTPDQFPTLNRIPLDGGVSLPLATRYFGSTTAIGSGMMYFDQLEVRRAVGLYGDLYQLDPKSRRVRRLTRDARLHDPDLSPDGRTLAAVQERTGHRALVLVRLSTPTGVEPLISDEDVQFNTPRWSPDGRLIAAERHRLGADPEVVVVDVAARRVVQVFSRPDSRVVMPAWAPDGRRLLAAVAPEDQPFNVYEFDAGDPARGRQLTHMSGGATWPEMSPDGRTLVFVGYTAAGYDLFRQPYMAEPVADLPGRTHTDLTPATDAARQQPMATGRSYSPLPTLRPTSWSPVIEWDSDQIRVGAGTFGSDVLGYHAYSVSASWLVSSPAEAPTPDRAVPDWFVSYVYDRWQPTLFASAAAQTSFFAGPATAAGTPSVATRRERDFEGGVLFPLVRARSSHAALATFFRSADEYTLPDGVLRQDRASLRAAWRSTTARTYGYSISPEDGVTAGATMEAVRTALGASADATIVTVDGRAYLHGLSPHHVVAARIAAGISHGNRTAGRTFLLGGAGPDASAIDFGSSAASLLRGFPANSFAGSHVAVASVEYRLPLVRPQRGVGTWPLFLHTIHAAVVADAGQAWTSRFRGADVKTSFGGELAANLVAGYYFPFTLALGAAHGHDGSATLPDTTTVYVRIGRAF